MFGEANAHPGTSPTHKLPFILYHCLLPWLFQHSKIFLWPPPQKKNHWTWSAFKSLYSSTIHMHKIAYRSLKFHKQITPVTKKQNTTHTRKMSLQWIVSFSPYFYCEASGAVVCLHFHHLLICVSCSTPVFHESHTHPGEASSLLSTYNMQSSLWSLLCYTEIVYVSVNPTRLLASCGKDYFSLVCVFPVPST